MSGLYHLVLLASLSLVSCTIQPSHSEVADGLDDKIAPGEGFRETPVGTMSWLNQCNLEGKPVKMVHWNRNSAGIPNILFDTIGGENSLQRGGDDMQMPQLPNEYVSLDPGSFLLPPNQMDRKNNVLQLGARLISNLGQTFPNPDDGKPIEVQVNFNEKTVTYKEAKTSTVIRQYKDCEGIQEGWKAIFVIDQEFKFLSSCKKGKDFSLIATRVDAHFKGKLDSFNTEFVLPLLGPEAEFGVFKRDADNIEENAQQKFSSGKFQFNGVQASIKLSTSDLATASYQLIDENKKVLVSGEECQLNTEAFEAVFF